MLQVMRKKAAFTLIELLVVVIIVAVLAAVGIPLMAGQIARARATEAESGLGTIRTALRSYFAERTTFVGATFANIGLNVDAIGNNNGDLDGRYFDDNDYSLPATGTSLAATTYCIGVVGSGAGASQAPRADQVVGFSRSMNELGNIFGSGNCSGVALN